ncbi:MAG TPA: hypothetical protein PKY28_08285 [Ferruginibacter sp.]|nr:hypothetical protein [Ferruginibacter sp.]
MSKKSFKDIEEIIKAAAGAHEPPFEEASWKKMEMLLDKEKDRRKPFFWIFRFALLAGLILSATFLYQHFNKQTPDNISDRHNTANAAGKIQPDTNMITARSVIPQHEPAATAMQNSEAAKNNIPLVKSRPQNIYKENKVNLSGNPKKYAEFTGQNKVNKKINLFNADQKKGVIIADNPPGLQEPGTNSGTENVQALKNNEFNTPGKLKINITAPEQASANEFNTREFSQKTNDSLDNVTVTETEVTGTVLKNDPADKNDNKKQDTTVIANKSKTGNDKKKKIFSKLYVTAALGAEASGTRFLSFSNSTVTPRYGFGVGFRISGKLSVQAGFYAGAKKYIAGPGDYNVKSGSYLSMVQIKSIKANCMVYEIPVTFQYNLFTKPKTVYYLSAGISSYLMKTEDYDFTVVRNNTVYTYPYYYKKNSHLLAALHITAGVEKKMLNKLYLQVAPFVNIPLNGVGEGKIKLYTTGLNVGLKYFPFEK